MKIAIVGAGIGGLAAARLLARGGAQVTVFERADGVESMRYDWHDDVDPSVFAECGLPVPEGSFPKKDWTFIAPNGGARSMHEEHPDVSVMRRELNRLLVNEARAAGAEVRFSSCVSELLLSGGRAVGVVAGGREVSADLVVDSSGVDSPLKKALGGLVSGHEKDEVFRVFRAFYARAENSKAKYSNKVYLKHLGEAGISWVIEDGGETDVLIGRVGELSEPCLARALEELKGQNPIIGEELVRGGGRYVIPVRYPATRMAADGYVLIGDSAFMTIPMLGSGIACSLNAANMLAECVLSTLRAGADAKTASSRATLWRYQRAFWLKYADFCGVDVIKRGVLSLSDEILSFILTSKVLSNAQICDLAKGRLLKPSAAELLRMAWRGRAGIFSLLPVAALLFKARKAAALARKIPEKYEEKAALKWENKLAKRFI